MVKKKVKMKMKKRKLEERIAPAMMGAGVVDPDLAESMSSDVHDGADEMIENATPSDIPSWMEAGEDGSFSVDLNTELEGGKTLGDFMSMNPEANTVTVESDFYENEVKGSALFNTNDMTDAGGFTQENPEANAFNTDDMTNAGGIVQDNPEANAFNTNDMTDAGGITQGNPEANAFNTDDMSNAGGFAHESSGAHEGKVTLQMPEGTQYSDTGFHVPPNTDLKAA